LYGRFAARSVGAVYIGEMVGRLWR
jgi:hypothetical protein